MAYSRVLTALSILATFATFSINVNADQNDPRLNHLFSKLPLSQENSNEKAQLESQIWAIWMIHDDPYTQYLLRKGSTEMTLGNLTAAEISFTSLVKLAPEFAEAWNKRATLRYIQNRYERSIADIRKTLLLEPRHFGAIAGLGLNFEALGERDAAIAAYEEALIVNPHMKHIKEKLKALKQSIIDEQI